MKKSTKLTLSKNLFQTALFTRLFLILISVFAIASGYAANISSTATGGAWNAGTSWVGGVIPAQGDNVTIVTGSTITVTAAAACTNLIDDGTLTMSNTGITLKIGNPGSNTGSLTLNAASSFFIGSANTVELVATQSSPGIINNGGTIISTGINGSDGGTIQSDASSGGVFAISGSAQTIVYNLNFIAGGSFKINASQNLIINGTFTIPNNNWSWSGGSLPPIYGVGSTLNLNNGGQGYTPGGNRYEWQQFVPGAGTIGVTPGYPNNVILANIGTSLSNYNGNQYGAKFSGAWSINGVFQLGTSTIPALVDLDNGGTGANSFSCGGIIIQNGSKLAGPDSSFLVDGNWVRTGTYINNNGTVTFGGSGTDTISVSAGTESSFSSLVINGASTLNVQLNSPVTLPVAGTLNLLSGIITSSSADILTITNSATKAIGGGSLTSYVNGPLAWSLATASNTYSFPVGAGSSYLPFDLTPNTSTTSVATVQAFNTTSGGTPDNVTLYNLDSLQYWSLTTQPNLTTGGSISVSTPTVVAPYNVIAESSTAAGIYSSLGGTALSNSVTNSGNIGAGSSLFFALGFGPLSIQTISITYPTCPGTTGSITVSGSGGMSPYTYAIGNGAFSSNNVFAGLLSGIYIFTVKDNTGATAMDTVNLSPILVSKDTSICTGSVEQLSANNLVLPNATYSWTSNPAGFTSNVANPTVSPTTTTTYIVSSFTIDPSTNLIVNPGFESGDNGFTSSYIDLTGNGQLPYTAAGNVGAVGSASHKGIYDITTVSNNMCSFFTPAFHDHTSGSGNMMVLDGPSNGETPTQDSMWSETVSVVPNTNYVFSYWLANADNNSVEANVQTNINGIIVPVMSGYSNDPYSLTPTGTLGWVKVSYLWNSGNNTTATISLFDLTNADVGNDFAIDDLSMYITCQVSDSVKVTVTTSSPIPTVTDSVTYCQNGTAVPLTATGTGLLWYTNATGGVGSSVAPTPSTTTIGSTTYYVSQTITGSCGESPRVPITVTVNAGGIVPRFDPVAAICSGSNLNALPTTSNNVITGTWSPALNNTATTIYTFTPTAGQCASTATLTINVSPLPTVSASADPSTPVSSGTSVTLTGTSNPSGSYLWTSTSAGVTNPADSITTAQPTQTTTYTLNATTNAGCKDSASVTVTITTVPCFHPEKAFTPNGDGVNDKWFVLDPGCATAVVNIYNRWGGLVFHSDNYQNDWDGKYKGVNTVPDGTYYYVIQASYQGQIYTLTGNVTIIR